MKRYIIQTTALFLLPLLCIIGINWLINPLVLFNSPLIQGINQYKTESFFAQQLIKPHHIKNQKPRSLILGSSRAGSAFDPTHSALDQSLHPYNVAIPGASPYILMRMFQHAQANAKIESVILSVDFFMFNRLKPRTNPGFDHIFEARLDRSKDNAPVFTLPQYLRDNTVSLISWYSLGSSKTTFEKQKKLANHSIGGIIQYDSGFWNHVIHGRKLYKNIFAHTTKGYLTKNWFPNKDHLFELDTMPHKYLSDDRLANEYQGPYFHLTKLLTLLYQSNIKTTIVILPTHVYLLEALSAAHLWNDFEQWKRDLITITEQTGNALNHKPYTIWDFNDYNTISQESVPTTKVKAGRMRWFSDPAHPNKAAGDIIIDHIYHQDLSSSKQHNHLTAFGAIISSDTIESHLTMIAQQQLMFREENPDIFNNAKKVFNANH